MIEKSCADVGLGCCGSCHDDADYYGYPIESFVRLDDPDTVYTLCCKPTAEWDKLGVKYKYYED